MDELLKLFVDDVNYDTAPFSQIPPPPPESPLDARAQPTGTPKTPTTQSQAPPKSGKFKLLEL
jgi:hypothetical protein